MLTYTVMQQLCHDADIDNDVLMAMPAVKPSHWYWQRCDNIDFGNDADADKNAMMLMPEMTPWYQHSGVITVLAYSMLSIYTGHTSNYDKWLLIYSLICFAWSQSFFYITCGLLPTTLSIVGKKQQIITSLCCLLLLIQKPPGLSRYKRNTTGFLKMFKCLDASRVCLCVQLITKMMIEVFYSNNVSSLYILATYSSR